MQLPSLFKVRQPKKFSFIARHYDEQKEDLDNRVENVKRGLGLLDNNEKGNSIAERSERISSNFQSRRSANRQASSTQFLFVGLFTLVFFLYVYFGNIGFIALILIAPIYFIMRAKMKK